MDIIEKAKHFIDKYMEREFDDEGKADYTDLRAINIAYTETEDESHRFEVNLNLVDYQLDRLLDGELVSRTQFESLEDMVENYLPWMNWDEVACISDFWDEEKNKPIKKE